MGQSRRRILAFRCSRATLNPVSRIALAIILAQSLCVAHTFERSYGTQANETGVGILALRNGGCLLVATAESVPDYSAILVVRVDSIGDTVWTRTIAEPGGELVSTAVAGDGDDGCLIVGSRKAERVDLDMYAVQLNSTGGVTWSSFWGSPDADDVATGVCSADSGWVVCGYTLATGQSRIRVDRLTKLGAHAWILVAESELPEYPYAVAPTSDRGFLVAGSVMVDSSPYTDMLLLKVSSLGAPTWTRTFGESLWDEARAVVQMPDDDISLAGFSSSYGQGLDVCLQRADSTGQGTWVRTFGFPGCDRAYGACPASDGGLVMVGERYPFGDGNSDLYMLKVSANGELAWDRFYGRSGDDCGYSVVASGDGGFLAAGRTWSDSTAGYDAYLVRTNANGTLGCANLETGVPLSAAVAVPNPFRRATRVHLQRAAVAAARVISVDGRAVRTLMPDARGDVLWDGADSDGRAVESGVYYLHDGSAGPVKLVRMR